MAELRLLRAEHADAVLDFEEANRAYFARQITDRGDRFFERFAEIHERRLAEQRDGHGVYYVLVEPDATVVGRVNLIIDGDAAVLGYRVAEHAAGRGLATAAVREVVQRATERGLRRIVAATSHENVASQRVLTKSGFMVVGPADPAEIGGKAGQRYELALPGNVAPVTSVRQVQVTFDCAEPERVARFWCAALGYVIPPPPDGFASWDEADGLPPEQWGSNSACSDPNGVGPRLYFQRVPEGKLAKNRVHLDVRVATGLVGAERVAALEADADRLVAAGATRVRLLPADEHNESCLVMQDVELNEFCLD